MSGPRSLSRVLIAASFLAVAAAQAWPLPLHLTNTLTGDPGGDTGVYVWNQWVFRHELIGAHRWPFHTDTILPLAGPVDLSLHNYTVFSDLLALPLQPLLGVVAAFNVVYLINVALSGLGVFLLARHVSNRAGVGTTEAWLAGVLFACSPFLVARSTSHFSLATAAALPFFLLCFHRTWHMGRTRDAVLAGVCLAWALFSDPYYAVYCVMLGATVMFCSVVRVHVDTAARTRVPRPHARRLVDAGLVVVVIVVATVRMLGPGAFDIGPFTVSMRSLYTPMLVLTLLVITRMLLTWPLRFTWTWPSPVGRALRGVGILGIVAAVLTAPELYALVVRALEGRMVSAPILWRSSAPGLDLLSFVLPNPNHPLAPDALVNWFRTEPGRYEENVASIPWTAILVILTAWRVAGHRPHRLWAVMAIGAASLALGPFLRVAGVETYVPTPWAIARYLPLISDARMPPRLAVLVILAVALLFAEALAALRRWRPDRQRTLVALVVVILTFEMLPVPRRLHSAEMPSVYATIARDPRPVSLLTLPFGIRDGLSSLGNFSAAYQFYQTRHGKTLIGGYLSRVSEARKNRYLSHPFIAALAAKSEGLILENETRLHARAAARDFMTRSKLGYVLIYQSRTTPELRQFAIEALGLRFVEQDGDAFLYEPTVER